MKPSKSGMKPSESRMKPSKSRMKPSKSSSNIEDGDLNEYEKAVNSVLKGENRGYVSAELEDVGNKVRDSKEEVFKAVGELIIDLEPGIQTDKASREVCARIWSNLTGRHPDEEVTKEKETETELDTKRQNKADFDDEDEKTSYDVEFSPKEIREIEEAKALEKKKAEDGCVLCLRLMPLTWHHLIPKTTHRKMSREYSWTEMATRGIWVCRPCHSAIHRIHDNFVLAEEYNSLKLLEEDVQIQKWVKYASKLRPTTVQAKNSKLRYKK